METLLNLSFSPSKSAELYPIGQIKACDSWERIKRLNLSKPDHETPNIVIMDLMKGTNIEDTELVSLGTAEWFLGDFWKIPNALNVLSNLVKKHAVGK